MDAGWNFRDPGRPCAARHMFWSSPDPCAMSFFRKRFLVLIEKHRRPCQVRAPIEPRWAPALAGIETCTHLVVLYWMDRSRRDIAVQFPRHYQETRGTFALRS